MTTQPQTEVPATGSGNASATAGCGSRPVVAQGALVRGGQGNASADVMGAASVLVALGASAVGAGVLWAVVKVALLIYGSVI